MNSRDFGLNHSGAGKGDKDRSPRWRDNYDGIDWQRPAFEGGTGEDPNPGFDYVSPGRIRKTYKTA